MAVYEAAGAAVDVLVVDGMSLCDGRGISQKHALDSSRFFDRTTLTLISAVLRSGGCQQSDDLIDRLVGAVVRGFELAVWPMFCIGLVVEAAVGEWSAQTFVEE
jgi:hypothetical protein